MIDYYFSLLRSERFRILPIDFRYFAVKRNLSEQFGVQDNYVSTIVVPLMKSENSNFALAVLVREKITMYIIDYGPIQRSFLPIFPGIARWARWLVTPWSTNLWITARTDAAYSYLIYDWLAHIDVLSRNSSRTRTNDYFEPTVSMNDFRAYIFRNIRSGRVVVWSTSNVFSLPYLPFKYHIRHPIDRPRNRRWLTGIVCYHCCWIIVKIYIQNLKTSHTLLQWFMIKGRHVQIPRED